ncbi:hypothetical protein AB0E01_05935 [Nocardia vinacea]|uniref:hypothetical protein n=1 Tax=Nocardia vinacea TaxID=96468 RepID=UPI0033CA6886
MNTAIPVAVVLNDIDLSIPMPRSMPGWVLERPSMDQVESFRETITAFYATSLAMGQPAIRPPHEGLYTSYPEGWGIRYGIPSNQWRYSIVRRHDASGLGDKALDQAFRISDADLWIPLRVRIDRPYSGQEPNGARFVFVPGGNAHQAFQFYASRTSKQTTPETPDLDEVAEVVNLRAELDDEAYPEIAEALADFVELDGLAEQSRQKFLGYFAVIERLLTHNPKPSDPVDSLTTQLKRNVVLLDHRLPDHRKIGFDSFNGAKPDKVIANLYAYRSAVAHGGSVPAALKWFNQNHPKTWSSDYILDLHLFTRTMTKRVLIAAMREPLLVRDLTGS